MSYDRSDEKPSSNEPVGESNRNKQTTQKLIEVDDSSLQRFKPDTAPADSLTQPAWEPGVIDESAMINSFVFSNMCPQHDRFNRGIWARLEDKVRAWAIVADGVFIVTGAVFDKDGDGSRDADADADMVAPTNKVAIPTHFYKIVLHVRPSGFIDTISILLPHLDESVGNTNMYLFRNIVTIDEIENLTGIDFFPGLPDQRETAVEAFKSPGLWHTQ